MPTGRLISSVVSAGMTPTGIDIAGCPVASNGDVLKVNGNAADRRSTGFS
jgi:hypothetical protein